MKNPSVNSVFSVVKKVLGLWLLTSCLFVEVTVSAAEPQSPLADAVEAEDWSRVKELANAGAAPCVPQVDGMTALHWAVFWDHAETISWLLHSKCDVNATTRYGVTPLSIACTAGNAELVNRLLKDGANPSHQLPGGETPLMTAARSSSDEVARVLIKHGAKVDATERHGQTALMWAAAAGNADAMTALIEAGADIEQTSKRGFTALMFAAREGRLDSVKILLAAGADPNVAINKGGWNERAPRAGTAAIMMALESGHFEIVLALVRAGVDPNDQRSGHAPLHALSWVRKPGRGDNPQGDPPPRGSGTVTSLAFVDALVAAGADVNLRLKRGKHQRANLNHQGATPFLLAAKTADIPLLQALLSAGADPALTNMDETTPLLAAAGVGVQAVGEEAGTESEVIETINLLFDLGADVNAIDKDRQTAMHGAAYRSFPRVVERLADLGADPKIWDRKNRYGGTPAMIAAGRRPGSFKPSPETVAALKAAAAQELQPQALQIEAGL